MCVRACMRARACCVHRCLCSLKSIDKSSVNLLVLLLSSDKSRIVTSREHESSHDAVIYTQLAASNQQSASHTHRKWRPCLVRLTAGGMA